MELPDFRGDSIVNLMASLAAGLGAPVEGQPPLPLLPPDAVAQARNVLLLVIDGLGHDFLVSRGRGGALHGHLAGRIGSVVPPTTASAIPTFLTGRPPARHGFTGWFTWFRELGCVTTVPPFVTRHGGLELGRAGVGPRELSGAEPLFDRLPLPCHLVTPAYIAHSVFNRAFSGRARIHPYESLDQFFGRITSLLGQPGRKYVYAYWPELDAVAHEHGIGSARAEDHFARLDAAFGRFLEAIAGSGSLVLATADHGFVDVPPERQLQLADHPELARCLALPLCGEPRFVYCYVRPGHARAFEEYVARALREQVVLFPSRELLERGLFGDDPDPRLQERIGDYVLVLRDGWLLNDRLPSEKPFHQVGVHGGLSAAELYVPLVMART